MKKLTIVWVTALVTLGACSQDTAITESEAELPIVTGKKQLVRLNLAKEDGIDVSQVSIYVYMSERKKDSLICSQTIDIGNGNIQLSLPLGEHLKAFAVANPGSVTNEDSLATVTINQDSEAAKEVYLSDIASFNSDYTTSSVSLTLKRLVGQLVVTPKESDLSNSKFDEANITFSNIGLSYKVGTGEVTLGDITLSTNAGSEWKAQVYSFPTTNAGASTKLNISFLSNGGIINSSAAPIDTETTIEVSKRYNIILPYLDEDYLSRPWTRSLKDRGAIVEITNM